MTCTALRLDSPEPTNALHGCGSLPVIPLQGRWPQDSQSKPVSQISCCGPALESVGDSASMPEIDSDLRTLLMSVSGMCRFTSLHVHTQEYVHTTYTNKHKVRDP